MKTKPNKTKKRAPAGQARALAVAPGSALLEKISRAIMEQFWGELPESYDWKKEASELQVTVTDSEPGRETVLEMAERVMEQIKPNKVLGTSGHST